MTTKKTYTFEEAKRKLENYCAYQERCHKEVEKKLHDMNMIAISKEAILLHLIEQDFLNEERFARSFARGKFRIKKWGKHRITQELKHRNISNYNIKIALKEISDDDYLLSFNNIANKRLLEIKETDKYKKRKKLADYLLYRGWENNLVYEKILELIP